MHKLIIASAGAGKSTRIVNESAEIAKNGGSVLIITYTTNNQKELLQKYSKLLGVKPASIKVKGWFTFLLEDMIRPYQRCVTQERIKGILFDQSNPHIRNGFHVRGRAEKIDGELNLRHFLTNGHKAHTFAISKLALAVSDLTGNKPTMRLAEAYDAIYIDEVQDLIGYDFHLLKLISKSSIGQIVCVGDFRQTIYSTSFSRKTPIESSDKIAMLKKAGFEIETMNESRRCIQPICNFSDLIHHDLRLFSPTASRVSVIPAHLEAHLGVFAINLADLDHYLAAFDPVILRLDRNTQIEICQKREAYNFGVSKGATFDRCLVFPTAKQKKFLKGKLDAFSHDSTEGPRNTFYVISTRARYSVAYVCEGNKFMNGIATWKRSPTKNQNEKPMPKQSVNQSLT